MYLISSVTARRVAREDASARRRSGSLVGGEQRAARRPRCRDSGGAHEYACLLFRGRRAAMRLSLFTDMPGTPIPVGRSISTAPRHPPPTPTRVQLMPSPVIPSAPRLPRRPQHRLPVEVSGDQSPRPAHRRRRRDVVLVRGGPRWATGVWVSWLVVIGALGAAHVIGDAVGIALSGAWLLAGPVLAWMWCRCLYERATSPVSATTSRRRAHCAPDLGCLLRKLPKAKWGDVAAQPTGWPAISSSADGAGSARRAWRSWTVSASRW